MRGEIAALHEQVERIGLQILVADAPGCTPEMARMIASPVEFERFLDVVAPGGADDIARLGLEIRADAIDASDDGEAANWVLAIAIDVPLGRLDALVEVLRGASEEAVRPRSVRVDGPDTIQ